MSARQLQEKARDRSQWRNRGERQDLALFPRHRHHHHHHPHHRRRRRCSKFTMAINVADISERGWEKSELV